MRLRTLRIQNFRAFDDQAIAFDDYTCLVGPNGGGKSTVFNALNVLFRDKASSGLDVIELGADDFCHGNTADPIRITATFDMLSAEAKEDLAAYVRHDQLVVSAVAEWDEGRQVAPVVQHGQRLVMRDFARYFDADKAGKLVADLRSVFSELREKYPGIRAETTKANMAAALRDYEEAHPHDCELVESPDQFYGWSRGTNLLQRHLQWVFVPAVKDASAEDSEATSAAIKQLVARAVATTLDFDNGIEAIRETALASYGSLLASEQDKLNDLSARLGERLKEWAHPDAGLRLVWDQQPSKAVSVAVPVARVRAREKRFESDLGRFGHGLQRCYLLALLQELSSGDASNQPRLLLAVEEPELYQHPPQARHLAHVLERLAGRGEQVAVCTHSPLFVRGERFSDVRLVRLDAEREVATSQSIDSAAIDAALAAARGKPAVGPQGLAVRLQKALQPSISEVLFAPYVVLVEGIEDRAYIMAWLELKGLMDRFRKCGGHIVPCDSKGYMIEPLAVLNDLGIRRFVVFDTDSGTEDENARRKHECDNRTIFNLAGYSSQDPLPTDTVWKDDLVAWSTDIGSVLRSSFGAERYHEYEEQARQRYSLHVPGTKKSPMFVGLTVGLIVDAGETIGPLSDLCEAIVRYGEGN